MCMIEWVFLYFCLSVFLSFFLSLFKQDPEKRCWSCSYPANWLRLSCWFPLKNHQKRGPSSRKETSISPFKGVYTFGRSGHPLASGQFPCRSFGGMCQAWRSVHLLRWSQEGSLNTGPVEFHARWKGKGLCPQTSCLRAGHNRLARIFAVLVAVSSCLFCCQLLSSATSRMFLLIYQKASTSDLSSTCGRFASSHWPDGIDLCRD